MTKNKKSDQTLIGKWQDRLNAAKQNQVKIFDKAKENYEIYYAQVNDQQRAKSPWKSNVFLPLLPGKARDTKAKLSIIEPRFKVVPADAWKVNEETQSLEFDTDALIRSVKVSKKLNREYCNYSSDGSVPPSAAVDFCNTDAIVAGWGLALAPLSVYRKTYNLRRPLKSPDGSPSAYASLKDGVVKKLLRTKTELVPLDIFRVYISPKATSWYDPKWIIIEREESYADLEKQNTGRGENIYNIPPELKKAKASATKNDYSAVRQVALGYQQDGSDMKDESLDMFNIYDCYDQENGMFYTFIEASIEGAEKGWFQLRAIKNPYNHGMIPVVPFYVKQRPHSPWGESFFEIAKDVQYAYNASFNQFRDNSTLSGETMAVVDKNSIVDGYEVGPGNVIEYDSLNGEKPEPWKFTDPNPAVLNAQMEFLEKNAENGTTPQYNSGQVNSSMDKTAGTRGGIEMLLEMANDKVSEMYRNLKSSLLRYGYISLNNAQQFQNYIEVLDTPNIPSKVKDVQAINVDFLTPVELQDAYDLEIDDESMLPVTKSERRRMFLDFIDVLVRLQKSSLDQAQLYNTPEDVMRIDWQNISKEIGNRFGDLDALAFLEKPLTKVELAEKKVNDAAIEQHATDTAAKIAQSNNPNAQVDQTPQGLQVQHQQRELINFKDLPADSKNPTLESLGYPPSQLVDEEAQAQLAENRSKVIDTQVKEMMVQAAQSGRLDPDMLAKFIKK